MKTRILDAVAVLQQILDNYQVRDEGTVPFKSTLVELRSIAEDVDQAVAAPAADPTIPAADVAKAFNQVGDRLASIDAALAKLAPAPAAQ